MPPLEVGILAQINTVHLVNVEGSVVACYAKGDSRDGRLSPILARLPCT